jgi:hypothetical protein
MADYSKSLLVIRLAVTIVIVWNSGAWIMCMIMQANTGIFSVLAARAIGEVEV